ncbi:hypothetical protein BDV32DRAFT_144879 [Aspergillus pseudonomiae]|nr:hypothetical protein BDV32DRAFT_144879 [Aspergillus pseudonomiae]
MNPSKRRADSPELESQRADLQGLINMNRKKLKAQGSFNATFWAQSEYVANLVLRKAEVERKISLRDFTGPQSDWEKTDAAKSIMQTVKAQQTETMVYKKRKEDGEEKGKKRRFRALFMRLFTTSKMGLGIMSTGAGKRDPGTQSAFRNELIAVGNAKHETEDYLWCPVLGEWCMDTDIQAAHLFPYMHGQDAMDAIFGRKRPPELFSTKNGLLLFNGIERVFDAGKLVIVPDLTERPAIEELLAWIQRETREYKIKVIDLSWDRLDKRISAYHAKTWRDLDGQRLQFRTSFRPAARYLYYHYCVQVLRRAWGHNTGGGALPTLKNEIGKPFWGTPGRYLPKNMLLAIVEEIGHDYKELLEGAASNKGDNDLLLAIASCQVKSRPALRPNTFTGEEEDSEEEEEEEEEESDDE